MTLSDALNTEVTKNIGLTKDLEMVRDVLKSRC